MESVPALRGRATESARTDSHGAARLRTRKAGPPATRRRAAYAEGCNVPSHRYKPTAKDTSEHDGYKNERKCYDYRATRAIAR